MPMGVDGGLIPAASVDDDEGAAAALLGVDLAVRVALSFAMYSLKFLTNTSL